MRSEQAMLKATFFAALLVLMVNVVTVVANWMAYFDRAQVFWAVGDLQKRVAALEATQLQPPRPPQAKGQQK